MMHTSSCCDRGRGRFCAGSPALAQDKQPPLRTGVDGTFAPHAMPKLGGGIEGFQIDLFTEVAKRMKREITIDCGELLDPDPGHAVRPLRLHRRADHGDQGARREHAVHRGLSVDRLPVRHQEGHAADQGLGGPQGQGRWPSTRARPTRRSSKQMGEKHGFTVQAYDTQPDATQAVLSGRAYATLGGNTTIVYAASKNPQFVADLELKETRAHWAAPVPKDNVAAAQPAAGRARLHEEGRHHRQVLREVVRQEAGRRTISPS